MLESKRYFLVSEILFRVQKIFQFLKF